MKLYWYWYLAQDKTRQANVIPDEVLAANANQAIIINGLKSQLASHASFKGAIDVIMQTFLRVTVEFAAGLQ